MYKRSSRALNACQYCRSRKSRCDEGNPSCSNCIKKGIECIYGEVKPTKLERTLTHILSKIEGLDDKFNRIIDTHSALSVSSDEEKSLNSGIDSSISETSSVDLNNFLSSLNNGFKDPYIIQDFDFLFNSTFRQSLIDSPKFSHTTSSTGDVTYDNFLEEEDKLSFKNKINLGDDHYDSILNINPSLLFNNSTQLQLIKNSYMMYIYSIYPIVCYDSLERHEAIFQQRGFRDLPEVCVILLVNALGSISSNSESDYWKTNYNEVDKLSKNELPPGFQFIWVALGMRSKLVVTSGSTTFMDVIIDLLFAFYYLKIGDFVSFWDELQKAHTILFKFLSKSIKNDNFIKLSDDLQDLYKRLFWISLHFERNFLKMITFFNPESYHNHYYDNYKNDTYGFKRSRLGELQKSMDLPTSCKPMNPKNVLDPISQIQYNRELIDFLKISSNLYSYCFMSNILLTNLSTKSFEILNNFKSNELFDFISLTERLISDFEVWKNTLPIHIQWDISMSKSFKSIKVSENIEVILLKFNYHKSLSQINFFLMIKFKLLEFNQINIDKFYLSFYNNIIIALNYFCSVDFQNHNLLTCFEGLEIIGMIIEIFRLNLEIFKNDVKLIVKTLELIKPYSLHSVHLNKIFTEYSTILKSYKLTRPD